MAIADPPEVSRWQRLRPDGPPGEWRRLLVAVLVAGTVAAVVLTLTATGLLGGKAALVALGVVAVALPTSRELSRRVLIAGITFLGWIPLLWWWRIPVTHVSALLALLVAALTGWLVHGPVRSRLRALVPRLRWADSALAVSVGLVVWVNLPGLILASPGVTLSRLLRGWDHSAHYDMTAMIVSHGTLINRIGDGPMGTWSYASYPQGYHAATATLIESLLGSDRDPTALLSAYGRAMTLVVVLAVATVLAGVCSLPVMRRRPLLAMPAAVFVAATFTLGPGGMIIHDGFPNFMVAVAALACIPLVAIQMSRPTSPPLLVALGAAALAVAHNWSLLLTMGALGILVVLVPWRRNRWPRTARGWVAPGVIAVATAVGLAAAWSQLRHQPSLTGILVVAGGVNSVPVSALVATVGAAIAACAALALRARGSAAAPRGDVARTAWAALLPLVGCVVAAGIAAVQIRAGGDVGYYFWKYAIALQLLSVVLLVVALAQLLPVRVPSTQLLRVPVVLASSALAIVAVQVYGLPTSFPSSLGAGVAPGVLARADFAALGNAPGEDAVTVVDAALADTGSPDVPHILIPIPTTGTIPQMMLSQWYNALTGRWTDQAQHLLELAEPGGNDLETAMRFAVNVLQADPVAVVVMSPEYVGSVRSEVSTRGWSDRVVSW